MFILACITCALCAYIALTDKRQGFCKGSSSESKYILMLERNLACLAYGRALQARKQFVRGAKCNTVYGVQKADLLCDNVVSTRQHYLALQAKCLQMGYINVKRSSK